MVCGKILSLEKGSGNMLRFELPTLKRKEQAIDYIHEFHKHKSNVNGTGGLDINDYENWLKRTIDAHKGANIRKDRVPASTYFVFDEDDKLIGMCNIRHILSEYLITSGSGHIGYSVRPNERRKGYATSILQESLNILRNDFSVAEALVGCYKGNVGSNKTIIADGGILQREILEENGETTIAYTIQLNR